MVKDGVVEERKHSTNRESGGKWEEKVTTRGSKVSTSRNEEGYEEMSIGDMRWWTIM